MLDFNNEAEQKNTNYGPVPAGSKVMVSITVEMPQYAVEDQPYVSKTKKGLRGLWCKFSVTCGAYEGVSWYDNLWLSTGYQVIQLEEKQQVACNRSGALIRAIIEAHRGIKPKDIDPRAVSARRINDWTDLSGMEFPAKLGISKKSYTGKDGKEYWNNYVMSIITPDKDEYLAIKSGHEVITDGPVTGNGGTQKPQTYTAPPEADTYGQPFPYDDPPF
ncbi:MAG: hypothetical protein KH192_20475 [Klebsiella aerogenes]|nr:hypothetical protein [Klebsiella aerogenes]